MMTEKREREGSEERELTKEQIEELERHDVPPNEQHQAQSLRERPLALPENPLFKLEQVQGEPQHQRTRFGQYHTEYPLPHRNEYPDDAQREAIEAVEKRLGSLRRTMA